jgi:hypothetical protein
LARYGGRRGSSCPLLRIELTTLVRRELDELGASGVRFTIRPLPQAGPNWYIETELPFKKLRRDEQAAVSAASFDLRSKYYLIDGPLRAS